MRIAMIGVTGNSAMRLTSHNAGWTYALIALIKSKFGSDSIVEAVPQRIASRIHDYDVVIMNEGINFIGKFNFFGGMGPDNLNVLHELSYFKGKCFVFNEKIDWSTLLKRSEIRHHAESIRVVNELPKVETIYTHLMWV